MQEVATQHLPAPAQRLHAGIQLVRREGLDQIVVRSLLESQDAVRDAVTCGQYQHGRLAIDDAKAAEPLEPVSIGKTQVENDEVEAAAALSEIHFCRRHRQRVARLHDPSARSPAQRQFTRNIGIVLDQQHPHGRTVRGMRAKAKAKALCRFIANRH